MRPSKLFIHSSKACCAWRNDIDSKYVINGCISINRLLKYVDMKRESIYSPHAIMYFYAYEHIGNPIHPSASAPPPTISSSLSNVGTH